MASSRMGGMVLVSYNLPTAVALLLTGTQGHPQVEALSCPFQPHTKAYLSEGNERFGSLSPPLPPFLSAFLSSPFLMSRDPCLWLASCHLRILSPARKDCADRFCQSPGRRSGQVSLSSLRKRRCQPCGGRQRLFQKKKKNF